MSNKKCINKNEAVELIKKFIEFRLSEESWYNKINEYLIAIILYGSVAKEVNRIDSDIDILLILPLEIEKKYTTGEYFYQFEGREINIVIRSIERLCKIAKEKNNKFQKEIFRGAKIILSKDDNVVELLRDIQL